MKEGVLSLNKSWIELDNLILELELLFKEQINGKKLKLQFSNDFVEEQTKIYTDEKRLKQILINFISNSIKFTLKGGIFISFLEDQMNSALMTIIVKDTGIGMT